MNNLLGRISWVTCWTWLAWIQALLKWSRFVIQENSVRRRFWMRRRVRLLCPLSIKTLHVKTQCCSLVFSSRTIKLVTITSQIENSNAWSSLTYDHRRRNVFSSTNWCNSERNSMCIFLSCSFLFSWYTCDENFEKIDRGMDIRSWRSADPVVDHGSCCRVEKLEIVTRCFITQKCWAPGVHRMSQWISQRSEMDRT